jgi:uncharacterized membrane protein YqaE (UPF0057 family)
MRFALCLNPWCGFFAQSSGLVPDQMEPLSFSTGRLAAWLMRAALIWSYTMDIIRIIFAILLPPVGVFMQVGFAGAFWLNILLTLLGYFPGIIHAVYIIASRK